MRWQYIAPHAYWAARENTSLTAGDLPEVAVWGLHPEEEGGQGGLRGQENWGRRYVSRQCHAAARSGVSGSESSKGHSSLGASVAVEFILGMASRCCIQFHEVCKAGRL